MSTNSDPSAARPQAPAAFSTPFVLHSNVLINVIAALVVAPVAFLIGFWLSGASFTGLAPVSLIAIMVVMVVFVLASSKRFVIEPEQVKVFGPFGSTGRKVPIDGIADLVLDGKKLKRRSDGKLIAKISSLDNADDVAALKSAIPSA